ncbi:hypothetical protein LCGC14_1691120 [marine sediment metagenome]|uniref:Uncharacterized protein n=1 Tax=marine sediment metagenome TaxID=412755 RepID=A0A0F9HKQ7_9ZZZZ
MENLPNGMYQMGMFESSFDQLFTFLGIKHYTIMHDLVDADHLLKSVYEDTKFLKDYNPLKFLYITSSEVKSGVLFRTSHFILALYKKLPYDDKYDAFFELINKVKK